MAFVTRFLLLAAIALATAGCTGPRHLSGADFAREYRNSQMVHSAQSYKFLGVEDGKAYLSHSRVSLTGKGMTAPKVLVTDLADLPRAMRKEIENRAAAQK